jgi:adenine-specific DNA-methyltransferase
MKKERLGTYWDHFDYNNVGKEGGVPFPEGKKPIDLVRQCLELRQDNDGIVLDFFAGSGSTAHAVFSQNIKDAGSRTFILVQLLESISEKKEYQGVRQFVAQAGIEPNVSALAQERIRRSAKMLETEHPKSLTDLGFKVFRLDSSNIRPWDPDPEDLERTLLDNIEHIKADRTEQDVLYELLLKLGLDLCVPIETRTIADRTVHAIGAGVLMACLDTSIPERAVEPLALGIVDWHRELAPAGDSTVVFRDSAFANDVAKTNLAAILQQHGLQNVRSL